MGDKMGNILNVLFENNNGQKVKNPYLLKRQNNTKPSSRNISNSSVEPDLSLNESNDLRPGQFSASESSEANFKKSGLERQLMLEPKEVQKKNMVYQQERDQDAPMEKDKEESDHFANMFDSQNETGRLHDLLADVEIKIEGKPGGIETHGEKQDGVATKNAFLTTMESLKKQSKSRRPPPEEQIVKKLKASDSSGHVSKLNAYSGKDEEDKEVINFAEKVEKKQSQPMLEVFGNQEMRFSEKKIVSPWLKKKILKIKDPMTRLHCEIIDFYKFITPSEEEHAMRVEAFERLKNLIKSSMPGCDVVAFGSFETKLYLRGADIDLVVIDNSVANNLNLLNRVSKILLKRDSQYENINQIRSAKVPLVKCVEKGTKINFDISFNKIDGVKQIEEVKKAVEIYPEIKYLIMLMKCILRQRELNETYTGGVGSFLLFCMTLAFLREIRREFITSGKVDLINKLKLSDYLIKMMEFYGCKFDCSRNQIIMHDGGGIQNKDTDDHYFSLLSPQDPQHDIGSAAFKIKEVFNLFKNRFYFMTNYNFSLKESILKYVVNPSGLPFFLNKAEVY